MASGTETSSVSDPTFRFYSKDQAAHYSKVRTGYSPKLYDFILSYHETTGGGRGVLLDVGCGPGTATQDLASDFDAVVGVDPGEAMIKVANEKGIIARAGHPAQFFVCPAEEIDKTEEIAPGSVDLLISAMAIHWFEMPKFWAAAARVLKPGGTVAAWTHASLYCHPSTSNAKEVQKILSELEDDILGPYMLPQNQLSRNLYSDLPLPWSEAETADLFDRGSFLRREWDTHGELTEKEDFFGGSKVQSLADLGRGLGSASAVTRWRDANPGLVDSEEDCVRDMTNKVMKAMGGTEGSERTQIRTGSATAILCLKRSPLRDGYLAE